MSFTLVSYTDPVWANVAQTQISAQVVFAELGATALPFTADKNDIEPHGVAVFNAIVAGAGTIPIGAYPLAAAQALQLGVLAAAYRAAITTAVTYTSKGGVTKSYQADPSSVSNLQNMLLAFGAIQAAPPGFYWVAADNTQVPFTYADMQGLAQVLGTQGAAAFQKLQTLKAQVAAATTVAGVQAITW